MLKLIYIMFHNWSDKNLYNFPGVAFGLVGLLSGIDDRKQNFSLFIVVMSTDINHWSSDFFFGAKTIWFMLPVERQNGY